MGALGRNIRFCHNSFAYIGDCLQGVRLVRMLVETLGQFYVIRDAVSLIGEVVSNNFTVLDEIVPAAGWFRVRAQLTVPLYTQSAIVGVVGLDGTTELRRHARITKRGRVDEMVYISTRNARVRLVLCGTYDTITIVAASLKKSNRVVANLLVGSRLLRLVPRFSAMERGVYGLTLRGCIRRGFSYCYETVGRVFSFAPDLQYREWLDLFDIAGPPRQRTEYSPAASRASNQALTILLLCRAIDSGAIRGIDSVIAQRCAAWQLILILSDDVPSQSNPTLQRYTQDRRISVVSFSARDGLVAAVNRAVDAASGEYVLLMGEGDALAPAAIDAYLEAVAATADVLLAYPDEDRITPDGVREAPYFKGALNREMLLSWDYMSYGRVYQRQALQGIGGFQPAYTTAVAEYDATLKLVAGAGQSQVVHIPRTLYHASRLASAELMRSANSGGTERVVNDHLVSEQIPACVTTVESGVGVHQLRFELPTPEPMVTIIIPTRDQCTMLRQCVDGIVNRTDYANWEIIIVNNQSVERETLDYFSRLPQAGKIRVMDYPQAFNYSAMNNLAVSHARGAYVVLLNNDIDVISRDWLREMVSLAQRPMAGAIGAKLYYPDGRIQHAGIVLGIHGVAGHGHKLFPGTAAGYYGRLRQLQTVSAVTAACLLVSRSLYMQVGGLDERWLKVAYNDVDFCLKLSALGYRNIWTPRAELYHHESVSRKQLAGWRDRFRFRKEVLVMKLRWRKQLQCDAYYSKYLTLEREDYTLSMRPRLCDV